MKMFMYSLEGDVHEWYRSLLLSSIASLKDFHATFDSYCKRMYSTELLFEECCEEYELHFQHIINNSSSSVDEKEFAI